MDVKGNESINRFVTTPILLYHNIDGEGIYSLQLDTLKSHFELFKNSNIRIIELSDLVSILENPHPFPEKAIAISFDDGFLSMYTKLLPLISEYGYPTTLFVYTDNIYHRAKRNLTWKHLRELEQNGIRVECHSISHADLDALSKEGTREARKKLFEEIYLSKRIIELYLKKRIKYFAFPYGRYNIEIIGLCKDSGYERVFSTDFGSNVITRDNYCLRRTHIKRTHQLRYIEALVK